MSKIFLTSDTHFGHDRDFIWKPRGFSNVHEMNEEIVRRWNSLVTEEDIVYHLGDIMLGDDVSGYDIIKAIRKQDEDVPVIFTSARDQDLDKILGLELGSDDYITKPYSSKELVLRVNKIIKRVYKDKNSDIISYDEYIIDKDRRTVNFEDKEIKLTTLEFDLLLLFIENKNKCFSREEILNAVWGNDYFGTDRVVDDLVRRVRKKMPKLKLSSVYGYGYRLS